MLLKSWRIMGTKYLPDREVGNKTFDTLQFQDKENFQKKSLT